MIEETEKEVKSVNFVGINSFVDKHLEIPSPASKEIPDWYKQTMPYHHGHNFELSFDGPANTVKGCMPVLDVISTGWIQKTWCDIYIERNEEGQVYFQHAADPQIVSFRDIKSIGNMPIPDGYSAISFQWQRPWRVITPPGHSVLYTHPFYRTDLPFMSVSAVVDTDSYHSEGKVAFFLKDGFTGIIPKGTPMYQIIPFQKDAWVGQKLPLTEELKDKFASENFDVRSVFKGGYRKKYWNRPDFENDEELES
jgi:hypothetical protein